MHLPGGANSGFSALRRYTTLLQLEISGAFRQSMSATNDGS